MTNARRFILNCLPSITLAVFIADLAFAQSLNFGSSKDQPIHIYADNGLEWQQDGLVFIARGNARAERTDVTVFADELHAYYRKNERGGTDIRRLDALGKVRIKTPQSTTYGEKAEYHVDNAILVVSGSRVKLVTKTDTITANRQLEYWENKQMAVARGGAKAVRNEKKLNAETLVAYFDNKPDGNLAIQRIEAFDKVRVSTREDTAFSDRGVYNVESGIATLEGSVKVLRDGNVINGCSADINLNTGISRMHSCKSTPSGGKTRVKGILLPRRQKNK